MHHPRCSRDMIAGYDEGSWLARKLRKCDKDEPLTLRSSDELGDAPERPRRPVSSTRSGLDLDLHRWAMSEMCTDS